MRAPRLHVGARDEQALGAAQRQRARRLGELDVEAAEDAEAHAAVHERRLERGARREHRLLAVEEVGLVVDGEQLAVRRDDDGGVEDGGGGRPGAADRRRGRRRPRRPCAGTPRRSARRAAPASSRIRSAGKPVSTYSGSTTSRAPARAAAATAAPAAARFRSLSPSAGRSWTSAMRRRPGGAAADMPPSYRRRRAGASRIGATDGGSPDATQAEEAAASDGVHAARWRWSEPA